eukprot:337070-Prorocentrum_minimum.AAC.1
METTRQIEANRPLDCGLAPPQEVFGGSSGRLEGAPPLEGPRWGQGGPGEGEARSAPSVGSAAAAESDGLDPPPAGALLVGQRRATGEDARHLLQRVRRRGAVTFRVSCLLERSRSESCVFSRGHVPSLVSLERSHSESCVFSRGRARRCGAPLRVATRKFRPELKPLRQLGASF